MSFNPTNMNLALCAICLKEFYNLYDNEGCGIITNNKSGALLYDLLKWAGNDMTVEERIKKEVLEYCKNDYMEFQKTHYSASKEEYYTVNKDTKHRLSEDDFKKYFKELWTPEKHKKNYQELCKSKICEIWLNIKADLDKRVLPDEIVIPKLDSYYHKFRLLRED